MLKLGKTNKKKEVIIVDYAEKLKDLRVDNDLTQKQVATLLQIDQSYYSKYEKGKRPLPLTHLASLCLLYSVSADYILGLPQGLKWPRRK